MKPVVVLYNSGSGLGDKSEDIKAAFLKHKRSMQFVELGGRFEKKLLEFYSSGSRIFVAAGGDGTVNALVSKLNEKPDVNYGIIPIGTLNHLAKDLAIPMDIEEAVSQILSDKKRLIDIGTVDDKIFLNNSSVGIYARIANTKKKTSISPLRFILGIITAVWFVFNPPKYDLEVLVGEQQLKRSTPIIFIGNNKYDLTSYGLFNRDKIDQGKLCVFIIRTHNPLRLILVCSSILFGRINSTYFEHFSAEELEIHSYRKKLLVAFDGEVELLATPLKYKVIPKKIIVIA